MIEKSSTIDPFAAIASLLVAQGREGMQLPEAAPHNDTSLPLTYGDSQTPRPRVAKITTAEQLREELAKSRERMQPFLQNLAPPLPQTRGVRRMEDFQWRIEMPEDRSNFGSVLSGGGDWDQVHIPHYGPPLGIARTLYRAEFALMEDMFHHERQVICLDAVDYRCQVYLNDVCLGSHEGIFDAFEFDVTGVARRQANILLIRVENDFTMLGQAFSDGDTDGDKIYAATGLGYDDPEEGWHHCPPGMGIWQGVRFEGRSRLAVTDLFVRPLPTLDAVEIHVEVQNSGPNPSEEVSLLVSIHGRNFPLQIHHEHLHRANGEWVRGYGDLDHGTPECEPSMMGPGLNYLSLTLPIPDARLWDTDTPWLYQAQVKLAGPRGELLDAACRQFGMRRFEQDETSNPKGKFRLNGREIRLRGANTMGNLDLCVFRSDFDQLHDDILLAKLTNLNFLRLTQHPVQREVYEACDRLGLMLQTDMPLFGSIRRNQFHECVRQAAAMERLVRSHPSSVLISFINEPFPAARAKPHRFMQRAEMELFFDIASKAVLRENPDRVIKCVDGDYDPPVPEGMQDNHCYCGWYIGHGVDLGSLHHGNWMPVKTGWHFGCGEFGSEGLDSLEVMRQSYPETWLPSTPEELWNPAVIPKAQSMNFHYLWYPTPHHLEEWIESSQRHQEWITRLMAEAFRRLPGMNTFAIHLFIDAWPAGWMKTIMDVNRIPKRAWFTYRDVLSPVALSLRSDRTAGFVDEKIQVELWLANDLDEAPEGCMLDYAILHEGTSIASGSIPARLACCAPVAQGVIEVVLPECSNRSSLLLVATLLSAGGIPMHDTELELAVFPKPSKSGGLVHLFGGGLGGEELLHSLGLETSTTLQDADTILVTDLDRYLAAPQELDNAVRDGATVVFLPLPPGNHGIGKSQVGVRKAGMGPRHFVSCDSGHPMVHDFKRDDFKFWFDESLGHVSPILKTVIDTDHWTPILLSGDGGWDRPWGAVSVASERMEGQGCWRVCQLDWIHRIGTNPAAWLFAKKLMTQSKSCALENPLAGESGSRCADEVRTKPVYCKSFR
ncbi:MAG: glycoside hydrolase family 2 TIM barrel-domain containing protein [Akkermansiaceae bacterium]